MTKIERTFSKHKTREEIESMSYYDHLEYINSNEFLNEFMILGLHCNRCGTAQIHALKYCHKCGGEFSPTNLSIMDYIKCFPTENGLTEVHEAILCSEYCQLFLRKYKETIKDSITKYEYWRDEVWRNLEKRIRDKLNEGGYFNVSKT